MRPLTRQLTLGRVRLPRDIGHVWLRCPEMQRGETVASTTNWRDPAQRCLWERQQLDQPAAIHEHQARARVVSRGDAAT